MVATTMGTYEIVMISVLSVSLLATAAYVMPRGVGGIIHNSALL